MSNFNLLASILEVKYLHFKKYIIFKCKMKPNLPFPTYHFQPTTLNSGKLTQTLHWQKSQFRAPYHTSVW